VDVPVLSVFWLSSVTEAQATKTYTTKQGRNELLLEANLKGSKYIYKRLNLFLCYRSVTTCGEQ
jgi:hypothetical protein